MPRPPMSGPARRGSGLVVWAALWSGIVGLLFGGVTALTLMLWVTDPRHTQTTPVGDLGFFVLGAVIGAGFVSQTVHRAPVGVAQSLLAALALAVAGLAGVRVEPFVGGLVLAAAAGMLWLLRPRPRRLRRGAPASRRLGVLALVAWVGGAVHAVRALGAARDAGPSCFLGRCAYGDRLAEMAAVAVAIAAIATLASLRIDGWRLPVWSAGVGAVVVGAVSVAMPVTEGSLGVTGGALAFGWGVLFVAVGEREWRITRRESR
jgi:hypothetical protein